MHEIFNLLAIFRLKFQATLLFLCWSSKLLATFINIELFCIIHTCVVVVYKIIVIMWHINNTFGLLKNSINKFFLSLFNYFFLNLNRTPCFNKFCKVTDTDTAYGCKINLLIVQGKYVFLNQRLYIDKFSRKKYLNHVVNFVVVVVFVRRLIIDLLN